jgi:hypothetical protein
VGTYSGIIGTLARSCRNEYLAAENQILRAKLNGRSKLSEAERAKLGAIGRRLGRTAGPRRHCVPPAPERKRTTILAFQLRDQFAGFSQQSSRLSRRK